MHIKLITVSHKMPAWVKTATEDYQKRLKNVHKIETITLAPAYRPKSISAKELRRAKAVEAEAILGTVSGSVWVLDVLGKMLDTPALAHKIAQVSGTLSIIIGGADGVDASVLDRADFIWSLSALTLPHPLVQVVLSEQLYRAHSINQGHPYHRG